MSRTFSTKNSSVLSVKVPCRCGLSLKARHTLDTEERLTPARFAILRVLQWVHPDGSDSSVARISSSTFSSLSLRCTFGLGESERPSTPWEAKRFRHFPTVCSTRCSSSATSRFVLPSAHRRMMRAL